MQTIWHDSNGRVKAVYDGGTTSTAWDDAGYTKAVSDPDKVGRVSQDHVVTVEDGEVVDAVLDPLPTPAAVWMERISQRADTELQRGVSVIIGTTTYGIRTGQQALSLISGAGLRAERAERKGERVSRKVATDKGIVSFSGPDLLAIFSATEDHHQAIMGRVEELQAMVADGTITDADLETGWPA